MVCRKIDLPESQIHIYESKHLPGARVTPHHHDVYEVLFFLNGEGRIELEGVTYNVNRDQMVLIAPKSEHAVYAGSKMTLLVLAFGDFLQGLPGKEELFERALSKSKYAMVDNMSANELRESFREILYEQNKGDPMSDLAAKSHLLHALLVISRVWEVEYFSDSNAHRANVLKHYIDTRYFERKRQIVHTSFCDFARGIITSNKSRGVFFHVQRRSPNSMENPRSGVPREWPDGGGMV